MAAAAATISLRCSLWFCSALAVFLPLFCGLVLCPCLLPLPLPLPLPPLALGLFSLHFTRGAACVACALNRFASKLKHFKIYTHNCQKVLEFVYQRKVPFPSPPPLTILIHDLLKQRYLWLAPLPYFDYVPAIAIAKHFRHSIWELCALAQKGHSNHNIHCTRSVCIRLYILLYIYLCLLHMYLFLYLYLHALSRGYRTLCCAPRRKLSLRAENISQKIGFNFYDFHDETFRIAKTYTRGGGWKKGVV